MYGSAIIGVVGPPYPYCSLVAFYAFAWLRLCVFALLVRANFFVKKKIKSLKTALIISFTGHQDNFRLLYSKILQAQKCK